MLEIAKFSGAQVVGLNPCEYQLKRVKHHIEQDKMQDYCSFVKVSYRLKRLSSFYVYIIVQSTSVQDTTSRRTTLTSEDMAWKIRHSGSDNFGVQNQELELRELLLLNSKKCRIFNSVLSLVLFLSEDTRGSSNCTSRVCQR